MEEVNRLIEENSELKSQITALKSESTSLREVINRIEAQRVALDQTMHEILNANIALKAGSRLLENENKLNQINANDEVERLKKQLSDSLA